MSHRNLSYDKMSDSLHRGRQMTEQKYTCSKLRLLTGVVLAAGFALTPWGLGAGPVRADDRVVTILVVGDTGFKPQPPEGQV